METFSKCQFFMCGFFPHKKKFLPCQNYSKPGKFIHTNYSNKFDPRMMDVPDVAVLSSECVLCCASNALIFHRDVQRL